MEIREIELSQIKPAEYNPRKDLRPGDVEFEKLKNSIKEFGVVQLLVWNERTGNLIGGHQTYKVLDYLGWDTAQFAVVDIPEEKEKVLNIALNKISGEWDEDKLYSLLQDMNYSEIDLAGFEKLEVEELFDDFEVDDDIEMKEEKTVPDMELKSFEHWDYVVLVFKDQRDWLKAMNLFDIEKVDGSLVRARKEIGLGRVIDGKELFQLVGDEENNNQQG